MEDFKNITGITDIKRDSSGQSAVAQDGYIFHPFEISICGYSNTGKTTLITRLIESLSQEFDIGYIKYGIHQFEIDKEGKDTQRAWSSGASRISISDSRHTANIHRGVPTPLEIQAAFNSCDLVFIEGFKKTLVNKLLLIDDKKEILSSVSCGDIENVIGFIGSEQRVDRLPVDAPYFHRDDVFGIVDFIREYLAALASETPLYGLVLTGGDSRRMDRDKAMIDYHGRPQAEVVYRLLSEVCGKVFISSKKDQWKAQSLGKLPQIHDVFIGLGPLSGILSAMHAHPQAAWLVVACDLPYVDRETIERLLKNRNPLKIATCFSSAKGDLPEPLCSIYEPKIRLRLLQNLAAGNMSPRDILMHSPVETVEQTERENLENINNEEEFKTAKSNLDKGER